MVRPYGIKVNKRKERQERYDKEEDEEEEQQQEQTKFEQKEKPVKKKSKGEEGTSKAEEVDNEDNEQSEEEAAADDDDDDDDMDDGIPINLAEPNTQKKPGVVFILEKASLEVAKVGKTYQLLNSDDHANFLRKNNRNPADYRPDITHQALLMILDSPINKAGRLKAVYVRTEKGVLFEVKPHVRIPRTYKRFAGVMLQLLQKLSITAVGSREKLMRCIKTSLLKEDKLLPVNSRKIGFSHSSDKLVNMQKYLSTICNETDTVFVLGAMAHGKIECDYIDDFVAISGYPLSAAYCISRICEALSTNWNII